MSDASLDGNKADEKKVDEKKAFQAIAYILSQRYHVTITMVDLKKNKDTDESA